MKANEVVAANDSLIAGILAHDLKEGRLPFSVRVVRTEEELSKAVRIRQAAYARHVPALAEKLHAPEATDRDSGALVLLAESKMDGSPMGTMRIQTNRYHDLVLEQSVQLPDWLQGQSMVEATRLGVDTGRIGSVVKTALFKAFYLYCVQAGIDWMVIAGRVPLDRQYEALLFQDLFPGQLIPLRHANNIPHRVLALEVDTLQERWAAVHHPLHDFFFETHHADIDLSAADIGYVPEFSVEAPQKQVANA